MTRRLMLIAPFALAACSVLPDRPYVETRRFPLEPRRDAPPRTGRGRRTLLVRTAGCSNPGCSLPSSPPAPG